MEMLALVRAKRTEFIEELEADDPRLLMNTEKTKWERISLAVSSTDGVQCYRSVEACKYKWQTLLPDYKRVADVHKETGTNSMAYFELTVSQRRNKNLPKHFDPYVFTDMHDWLRHKPTMNPPHFRDLMHPSDGNYVPPLGSPELYTDDVDTPSSQLNPPDCTLHSYSSAAAYDATADSEDCDDVPDEAVASPAGNQTSPVFPSPPPLSSSAATFGILRKDGPPSPSPLSAPTVEFISSVRTSPTPTSCRQGENSPSAQQQPPWTASPMPAPQTQSMPHSGHALGVRSIAPTHASRLPPSPSQSIRSGTAPLRGLGGPGPRPAQSPTSIPTRVSRQHSEPYVISSSEISAPPLKRVTTSGSTGVRRKNHGGIRMVADATLEGNDRLVAGLKEINNTAKEMKV
jgi:hypothetical protein